LLPTTDGVEGGWRKRLGGGRGPLAHLRGKSEAKTCKCQNATEREEDDEKKVAGKEKKGGQVGHETTEEGPALKPSGRGVGQLKRRARQGSLHM